MAKASEDPHILRHRTERMLERFQNKVPHAMGEADCLVELQLLGKQLAKEVDMTTKLWVRNVKDASTSEAPKPPQPSDLCWRCKSPLEYEWVEFDESWLPEDLEACYPEDLAAGGFWQELGCENCAENRRELNVILTDLEKAGKL